MERKRYGHPELYGERPLCFHDEEEWQRWVDAEWEAARNGEPVDLDGYCELCTPAYQAKMKKEDRCAYPNVRFVVFNRHREPVWEAELTGMR